MKRHLQFYLNSSASIEKACDELERLGISDIYVIEDTTGSPKVHLGGWGEKPPLAQYQHVVFEKFAEESIDWEAQWNAFSPTFQNGMVHLDLCDNFQNKILPLLLKPGAGFGDFSHPTTRLVIAQMKEFIKGSTVIDIGCGSGILSLASIRLGAIQAFGVDIDQDAIEHSRSNAVLNNFTKQAFFSKDLDLQLIDTSSLLILMNMISSEQHCAWNALTPLHALPALIVTSGISISERSRYLALTQAWNWELVREQEEEGWLGFCFQQNSKPL